MNRRGLGRGLGALLSATPGADDVLIEIPVDQVEANPDQPRKSFSSEALEELIASIRASGVIQPVIVRRRGLGYQLIAGERRWRAARQAGLERIPAIVRDATDAESLELALVENLLREDLNPIDEAEAYEKLLGQFGWTQEELAGRIGRDRSSIANSLRLLRLPEEIQADLRGGRLTMGHARVARADEPDGPAQAARRHSRARVVCQGDGGLDSRARGGGPPARRRAAEGAAALPGAGRARGRAPAGADDARADRRHRAQGQDRGHLRDGGRARPADRAARRETLTRRASTLGGMAERIVVGMSGGVDSSVAAALLVEQGDDVVGVTMRVSPWSAPDEPTKRFGSCCGTEAADDARSVARALGVPYYVLNMEGEFDRAVVGPFADAYRRGETPVPCLQCNSDLKFGSLLRRARAWEAAAVATGHYARVTRDAVTGRHLLLRARDARKDQTDFLWPLTQAQLEAARFPVGELTKDEVRGHARRLGLVTADKPESQEICFVPDDDYRGFLRRREPRVFRSGPIVDLEGRVLGMHGGVAGYTIGQKKGLGLAVGRPLYVVDLDPERATVVVGGAGDLERDRLVARSVNFIACPPPSAPMRVEAKIRHSHAPASATVRVVDADRAEVVFDEPQRAIAPGQSVVWYRGECVIGGGVIAR